LKTASYLQDLTCPQCGATYAAEIPQRFCELCRSPILARYDLEKAAQEVDRDEMRRRAKGMWRWHELLPSVGLEADAVAETAGGKLRVANMGIVGSLGEGDTPLLTLEHIGQQLGVGQLYVKDESQNPTGTFKARGLAAAVLKAKELGVCKLIIPTAGNAGGALAAYAAAAGMEACVIMPADTPRANILECQAYSARLILVEGLISDAAKLANELAQQEGWFDVSTFKEPYRVEGKKVMGYELAETFGWRLPDVIIYPTGGGTGLVGMWKAFAELEALGWLEDVKRPRLVSVQAEGCAPVTRAFEQGAERCEFWQEAQTIASGLRVPLSFADRLILRDIRQSKGTAVAVSDGEITQAQQELGKAEGIFAAPEGAATLAALKRLVEAQWLEKEERVVLFNTGSGLKYV